MLRRMSSCCAQSSGVRRIRAQEPTRTGRSTARPHKRLFVGVFFDILFAAGSSIPLLIKTAPNYLPTCLVFSNGVYQSIKSVCNMKRNGNQPLPSRPVRVYNHNNTAHLNTAPPTLRSFAAFVYFHFVPSKIRFLLPLLSPIPHHSPSSRIIVSSRCPASAPHLTLNTPASSHSCTQQLQPTQGPGSLGFIFRGRCFASSSSSSSTLQIQKLLRLPNHPAQIRR